MRVVRRVYRALHGRYRPRYILDLPLRTSWVVERQTRGSLHVHTITLRRPPGEFIPI